MLCKIRRHPTSHLEEALYPCKVLKFYQHWASPGLRKHLSQHILCLERDDVFLYILTDSQCNWCANKIQHTAYPQPKAPGPPKCLCSRCWGKWGLWCRLVSTSGHCNLARCGVMRGFYFLLLLLLYPPSFGSLHHWGEKRSSESQGALTKEVVALSQQRQGGGRCKGGDRAQILSRWKVLW